METWTHERTHLVTTLLLELLIAAKNLTVALLTARVSYYGEGCQEAFGYLWHLHHCREDYIKVGLVLSLKGELFQKLCFLVIVCELRIFLSKKTRLEFFILMYT